MTVQSSSEERNNATDRQSKDLELDLELDGLAPLRDQSPTEKDLKRYAELDKLALARDKHLSEEDDNASDRGSETSDLDRFSTQSLIDFDISGIFLLPNADPWDNNQHNLLRTKKIKDYLGTLFLQETSKGNLFIAWKPNDTNKKIATQAWCSGFAMDTFDFKAFEGYTINNIFVQQVLEDDFDRGSRIPVIDGRVSIPTSEDLQEGDIIALISPLTADDQRDIANWRESNIQPLFIKKKQDPNGYLLPTTEVVRHLGRVKSTKDTLMRKISIWWSGEPSPIYDTDGIKILDKGGLNPVEEKTLQEMLHSWSTTTYIQKFRKKPGENLGIDNVRAVKENRRLLDYDYVWTDIKKQPSVL